MEKKPAAAAWIGGFILLSLYVHLTPHLFGAGDVPMWFAYWAGFFILAFLVSKYLLKLEGLKALGMQRHKGWLLNLTTGFILGFAVYALKYLAFYELGKFEVVGWMSPDFILPMLGQALLAMFFSSILNDITIRGYWYACLQRRRLLAWYLLATTALYTLLDGLNAGFGLENLIFSAILGLAFAYTVLKTGSIWMSLGLHWGGNVMFRVMYGFDGQGIFQLEQVQEAPLYDYVSLFVTALLLPAVYFILRGRSKAAVTSIKANEEAVV